MLKKCLVILTAILIASVGSSLAEEIKIGIIDVNKVLNETKEGTDAKNRMKIRYDELQERLSEKQGELKNMRDELEQQKIILGKDKIKEKEDELDKELGEFRKIVAESEKEMRDTESAYTQAILEKIKKTVDTLAKEKGFNLVVDRSGGVVYADEGLDITTEVLEILNKEYESAGNKSE
jgi:outer membrane protein